MALKTHAHPKTLFSLLAHLLTFSLKPDIPPAISINSANDPNEIRKDKVYTLSFSEIASIIYSPTPVTPPINPLFKKEPISTLMKSETINFLVLKVRMMVA